MKSYRLENKNTLPLPIICPPRRYVRWDRIAIITFAIAWWVGLIWCYLQYKGGQP